MSGLTRHSTPTTRLTASLRTTTSTDSASFTRLAACGG